MSEIYNDSLALKICFFLFVFFKVFLSDTFTCPILGPLVPLFWISGDVSSGFQSQRGSALFALRRRMYCTFPEIHLWCYTLLTSWWTALWGANRVHILPKFISCINFFFFFFKVFFLSDTFTCPILGPLVPLFWISGDVSSGFQSQSGSALFALRRRM